ncbi:hypothetical protein HHK36_020691 [Tetracentron sinense]|uniref:Wall-associated receptor kinase galacturonan-binding domain-containing protein n=1 Tax=Tetracentron sinense TaxID=13715 RepID=A0A835D8L4_TETSI|nr:hypothetical protein HHK36_020691 [Tetracentron sinense]
MEVSAALFSLQLLSFFLIVLHLSSFSIATELGSSLPNCSKTCGNVEISYPFGVGDGCFFRGFEVTCNKNIPFLAGSDLQLVEILQGEVRVNAKPFFVTSYTEDTLCSCTSICHTRDSMDDGSFTGQGCCQTTISRAQKHIFLSTSLMPVNENLTSPCSYGVVVVEYGSYVFRNSDAWDFNLSENVTTKLEWAIGDHYEEFRKKNVSICGENSIDYDSEILRRLSLDIKSSNILLDWNNTAKLSDFGISRLVPLDKNRVSTAVIGTIGPVQHEETGDYSSLVMHFKSCVGRGNLLQVLEKMVLEEAKMEEVRAIAGVASRCLTVLGARRPTMKKVARKLASMR